MQNAQILNIEPLQPQIEENTAAPEMEGEFHSADFMEHTRSEIRGMRLLVHQQRDDQDRRMRIFSMTLGVLILVFLAALWLVYPTLRDEKKAMAEMLGLQNTAGGLGERVNSVETSVGRLTAGLPALVDQFQTDMQSSLQAAHDQATQFEQRLRSEVQRVQTRLASVESTQKEAGAHVNQLQTQIARLNQELVSVREQASASAAEIKQLKDEQAANTHALSGLDERVATSQATITGLSGKIDRKRIDFLISKGTKTTRVTSDIDLTLKHADVGKQEVDVVLDLGGKNGDLPIRGQGIRKPVMFYMPDGNRQVELVITGITKEAVSGFLLMSASK